MDEHTNTSDPVPTPGSDPHRLPEGPAAWRLDDVARQRGRVGIALARESLRAALERRARREALADGAGIAGADGDDLELVA